MTTDNKPGFVPETPPDPSYPCGPLSNIRECASDFDPQTRVVATTHELKIAPEHFEEQSAGTKLFELRADDRGFKAGDSLRLREYANDSYTSREVTRLVVGLLRGPTLGLSEGWVILSTAPQWQAPAQTAPLDGDWINAKDVQRLVRELDVALNGEGWCAMSLPIVAYLRARHSARCAVHDPSLGWCDCGAVREPPVKLKDAAQIQTPSDAKHSAITAARIELYNPMSTKTGSRKTKGAAKKPQKVRPTRNRFLVKPPT